MAEVQGRIRNLAEDVARDLGVELVQAELVRENRSWYLRFTIDSPAGISIDLCEHFSRRIEPLLDAEDPIPHQYILEVSSAGLDRPLLRQGDYGRFAGCLVQFRFYEPIDGRRQLSGRLLGLLDEPGGPLVQIELETGAAVAVPFAKIARARLIPDI